MEYNPTLYNLSLLSENYYRYFEIGVGFFITDGGNPRYAETYDFKKYGQLIGGAADPTLSLNATRKQYIQGTYKRTFICMQNSQKAMWKWCCFDFLAT